MVIGIKVTVDSRKVENMLDKISFKVPKELSEAGFEICKKAEFNLKKNVIEKKLIWTGKLWSGIRARRISKTKSIVVIPKHGIYLDRMKPHYVPLKRGRRITQWVKDHRPLKTKKGLSKIWYGPRGGILRKPGRMSNLFVEPTPWISEPIADTMLSMNSIMTRRTKKAMMESV